jgi:predicted ThiF/HesA family dinucleotide-utilizing enzyme
MTNPKETLSDLLVEILSDLAVATEAREIEWQWNNNHALYKGDHVVCSLACGSTVPYVTVNISVYNNGTTANKILDQDIFPDSPLHDQVMRIWVALENNAAHEILEQLKPVMENLEGPWR